MQDMNDPHDARFARETIDKRFADIENRIRDALSARDPSLGNRPVRVTAVTKTVPADVINYAIAEHGIGCIGENRVQELLDKYDSLALTDGKKPEIHLIGHLQTNKVKYIVDKVDMIESLDSLKLAEEIDRRAGAIGKRMDVLIEINIGREEQKNGVFPEDVEALAARILGFSHLRLRGFMTIAPKVIEKRENLKYLQKTYQIFIDFSEKINHNIYESMYAEDRLSFDTLSMGMSDNFEEAIACGATEIRLGSALFGKRASPLGNQ